MAHVARHRNKIDLFFGHSAKVAGSVSSANFAQQLKAMDENYLIQPVSSVDHVSVKSETSAATVSDAGIIVKGDITLEEIIVYIMLLLLMVFFLIHLVRCVRTTLDPYNTVARVAWFETLNKARLESFP